MIIINEERSPENSLYYLGAFILKELNENNREILIEDLMQFFKKKNLNINLIYFSLDWLYLLNKIEIKNERIYLK